VEQAIDVSGFMTRFTSTRTHSDESNVSERGEITAGMLSHARYLPMWLEAFVNLHSNAPHCGVCSVLLPFSLPSVHSIAGAFGTIVKWWISCTLFSKQL
jgi:hypothetical protein